MARWLRAELHCHTTFSHDGHIRLPELARAAQRVRLDALAVTDHDTTEGAFEFHKYAARRLPELHVIIGEERTLVDHSHVIGLFLRESLASTTLNDVIAEIREQGGLAFIPHPFRRDGALRDTQLPPGVAFEVFNPKCSASENGRARELAAEVGRTLGGSDAHFASDVGECVTEVAWAGGLRESIESMLAGDADIRVSGVAQAPGASGRKYAKAYYRLPPSLRLPSFTKPAAKRLYRAYRSLKSIVSPPQLEEKFTRVRN
jgi:predicted metal-dependent phosphoesterase TrpH